jgi:hypothetical protein
MRVSHFYASITVIILLAGVTWLLFFSGASTPSFMHLYYVPIVLAGFFLGDIPGILVGFAASGLTWYSNFKWGVPPVAESTDITLDLSIRTVFFFTIGLLTARLAAVLEQRAEESATLFEVSHTVNQSLRLEEVLPNLAQIAAEISDGKACLIRLLAPNTDELIPAASWGLSESYLTKGPVHVADSSVDQEVVNKSKVVAITDIRNDPRFRYRENAGSEGLASCICVPIQRGGRALGLLRVYAETKRRWARSDQRMLKALADEAAVAIENARLHDTLRRSYWETVRALTRAIEAKDPQVLGHSERVTDYALQIGQRLNFSSEELETLRFAATLHDIGKIAVEEQLLRTTNPRAYREALDSNHPLVGMTILQPAEFLRPALDGVRYHHENFDGTGFPDGLKGEAIPLVARIIAVANTYDNLLNVTSNSMPPFTTDEALAELERRANSTLDPRLVEIFLAVMQERELI